MAQVYMAVINDLLTDQRVHRVCLALTDSGHSVHLFGSADGDALPLPEKPWKQERLPRWFSKNMLRYLELNLRLTVRMLRGKTDVIYANDLDVLGACCLVSVLRRKPLIYDSHEYFTGVPELLKSPLKRWIWGTIERLCLKRTTHRFTVNQSIASLLEQQYGYGFKVLRNVPVPFAQENRSAKRSDYGIPDEKFIVILQGSGINIDRGGEELVAAMAELPEPIHLVIAGSGDVYHKLEKISAKQGLTSRIHFLGRMPYPRLMQLTALCNLGVSLDKPTSINYRFSLPNKVFDYVQAGIPLIATDLIEVGQLVRQYRIGILIQEVTPTEISRAILSLYADSQKMKQLQENCRSAAQILHWDAEKQVLVEAFNAEING